MQLALTKNYEQTMLSQTCTHTYPQYMVPSVFDACACFFARPQEWCLTRQVFGIG